MTLDKRFAIIDGAGRARYPYRASSGDGKGKFILRAGNGQGRRSIYVNTVEEVIKGAVQDGLRLRVKTDNDSGEKTQQGSLSIKAMQEAVGYRIHPELVHLISASDLQPLGFLSDVELPIQRLALTPIEAAREFVQARVQRPAIQNEALRVEIKDKVRHSDGWLRQFKRVGDLYTYLQRFHQDKEDPIYLEMKALNLQTFEDIAQEFADRFSRWLNDSTRITDFVIGDKYSAHEILIFSGNYDTRAGGMFVIAANGSPNLVVIKATLSGGKYANEWLEPSLRLKYFFKSINRNGTQVFGEHFQTNAAILENRNIPILTFVRASDLESFTFQGVFAYASHHAEGDGSRWFELVLRENQPADVTADFAFLGNDLNERIRVAIGDSREKRLKRLACAPKKPTQVVVRSTAFIRNADVVAEVLLRAKGYCEHCGSQAPFISKSKGTPYLEVHHKLRLADGGDDTIENAIALCPNCHREQHFG